MLEIRGLNVDDCRFVLAMLESAVDEDLRYFHPFELKLSAIEEELNAASRDQYFGVWIQQTLSGFYMLRGLDEGYPSPMFGCFISQQYRGLKLGWLTLYHAVTCCRLIQAPSLMLKVYSANDRALSLYRSFGFIEIASDGEQIRMEYSLS